MNPEKITNRDPGKCIYISGLHSGPNPSPGVGIARSLRDAYPEATLVGVDYSSRSSGLHYHEFDDLWIHRPWDELDLGLLAKQIQNRLGTDGLWISGLDLETHWLATNADAASRILAPPLDALLQTSKPAIPAAAKLPASIPPHITAAASSWELHAFCRKHGWPVWCKGPNYGAQLAHNWREALSALDDVAALWSTDSPVLQAHVIGREESVAFCAYAGELLECVHMEKRAQTEEGKTWAGRISEVDPSLLEALRNTLLELRWTGGGELEFVRDEHDELHLIDWNPRFPAWIHGATLTGHNLPARLIEGAGFGKSRVPSATGCDFTRVVLEIPTRRDYPLPAPPPISPAKHEVASKHPSGMPLLAKKLHGSSRGQHAAAPDIQESIKHDLSPLLESELSTPARIFLCRTAQEIFGRVRQTLARDERTASLVRVAYSVKTNPDRRLLLMAKDHGFLAEAISSAEVAHALSLGFSPSEIVLNGPAANWPMSTRLPNSLFAVFSDSITLLKHFAEQRLDANCMGIRLRPLTSDSRFGVDLQELSSYQELVSVLKQIDDSRLGVHFHIQSNVIGIRKWWEVLDSMLHWASALQDATGREIEVLDIGGGWFPDDLLGTLCPRLPEIANRATSLLPKLQSLLVEPGKALAQSTMALATRILEVRNGCGKEEGAEIVVDGAVSDLPMAPEYPHRMILVRRSDGRMSMLGTGEDRVLGRTCMESDVLALRVHIPTTAMPGDYVVFCDAGGYDASMHYTFGIGDADGI
jgi:diaminopimelate decarboxylase